MPRRLVNLVLVLALALAVPLQGWAMAAAGACMALGHHDAPSAHAHDAGADGDSHHADDHGQPDGAAYCPPCTACCASAAIAHSTTLVPLDERTEALNVPAPPFFAGIQRTVVDRPPLAL